MGIQRPPGASAFFALVRGRVQGVAFRYSACHEAQRLGLTGWVRNTQDGDVEVFAEGPRGKLDALLHWLHRGPPSARVDSVRYELRSPLGVYRDFSVKF
jgi:acylphosphatase